MTAIRPLTAEDLDGAFALSTQANWNQQRDDWRMLIDLAGPGAFGADDAGRLVGTALGIDYRGFGWVAMMLVDTACRGRGLGARLLAAALHALPPGAPVRLDATPLGQPLYERHGFVAEQSLTRYVRAARAHEGEPPPASRGLKEAGAREMPSIVAADAAVFGGERARVLTWLAHRAPQYAFCEAAAPESAYCFGRQGRLFDQIGPVVAGSVARAIELAGAALARSGGASVVMDVFDGQPALGEWLRAEGFEPQRPLLRMCRPVRGGGHVTDRMTRDGGAMEFAILGPEFA